jgi:uncharacterized protein YecT (DUF1311 family)
MRRVNPIVLGLLMLLTALLIGVGAYMMTRDNQDRLRDDQLSGTPQSSENEKLCSSDATYSLIKRELFRRAAELRGTDLPAFNQLAGYAVLRMENPVLEGEDKQIGQVRCSGSLSLDLPPGVAAVGNRRSLGGDVDYAIQPSPDGTKAVLTLGNADAMIALLATLARTTAPPPPPETPTVTNGAGDEPAPTPAVPADPLAPAPRPQAARPSFDCDDARTRGEIAVCADAGLAALDRNMAAQYRRAISAATPEQRRLLQGTRDRFLHYRDSCTSRSCLSDAYVGRMREIRDIMEGTWAAPR